MADKRCGYVAIVGRPNVGKSTLLNHLLGQKLSITSRKPQTTRHNIIAIKSNSSCQFLFVDTPGIHKPIDKALNRYMNKSAFAAMADVDVVLFVVDSNKWTEEDERVYERVKNLDAAVIMVINKVDKLSDKNLLLPLLEKYSGLPELSAVIPVSALRGEQLEYLLEQIEPFLPEQDFFFDPEQLSTRPEKFHVAEILREKLVRRLGNELPYEIAIEIEQFKDSGKTIHIDALILVQKESQKRIVLGEKGQIIKEIGSEARLDMQRLLGRKVMLRTWVKVRSGWADDERALKSLGYTDDL